MKERENLLKDTLDIVKSLETCVASLETRDPTYIQHASDIVKDEIITNSKLPLKDSVRTCLICALSSRKRKLH